MSKIEWTDETWNPLTGCSPVSEGCRNCYAAREAAGRLSGHPAYSGLADYRGTGDARHPVFTGEIRLHPDRLDQPLGWRKPRRVFVNSMSDLFHEDVPFDFIAAVFGVMAGSPAHTFQVLTKRPQRMREFFGWIDIQQDRVEGFPARAQLVRDYAAGRVARETEVLGIDWPLPNVWLGTSVEDQDAADERIPHLLRTPAAVRFLSCEPLLGPVDLTHIGDWRGDPLSALEEIVGYVNRPPVDWVIVGGESGPGARPFNVAWAHDLIQQCRAAAVACFVKQLGAKPVFQRGRSFTEPIDLSDRKGGDPEEWPVDLRVREWPETAEVGT